MTTWPAALEDSPAAPPPDSNINHAAAVSYWAGVEADVNGMLGGYPHVSRVDLAGSRGFLAKLGIKSGASAEAGGGARETRGAKREREGSAEGRGGGAESGKDRTGGEAGAEEGRRIGEGAKPLRRVVDCGAGIGRITTSLLIPLAQTVDVVEPIVKFTAPLVGTPGIGRFFNVGLEDWDVESAGKYDLIWNQWCVGHLTDRQLVDYLGKCGEALEKGGFVVVKENLASVGDVYDEVDSSVTRYV
jgi:protein N-terminal methyltransferase